MTTVCIVNPRSAGGRTARRWPAMLAALERAGVHVETRQTAGPGDATRLAAEASRAGAARIVAVGGDGTLNEVVNGLFDEAGARLGDAVLGLLPCGTGGDFRRSVGIPVDRDAAAAVLAAGATRPLDAGRIDYADGSRRWFVNIADCGIGGEVVRRVNAARKRGSGTVTFLYHSLAALLTYRCRPARIEVDGQVIEATVQNVVVANGRYFGGGMLVAPGADPGDGRFEVVILGDIPRHRALIEIRRVYGGKHVGRPDVTVLRGTTVRVAPLSDAPLLFDVEGELVGAAPATLTCVPGALRLCAPAPA